MLAPMPGYGGGMPIAYAYPPDPYSMPGAGTRAAACGAQQQQQQAQPGGARGSRGALSRAVGGCAAHTKLGTADPV
jgi:hypothetical protein